MYILDLCDNPSILEAMSIIKIIIRIITIAVPVILTISLSIEYMNSIKIGTEDLLKKANSNAIKKIIAAILIFLIPTFVKVIVNMSNPDNGFAKCLNYNSTEESYEIQIRELMNQARNNNDMAAYSKAVSMLSKIKDEGIKAEYKNELNSIYSSISSGTNSSGNYTRVTRRTYTASPGGPSGPGGNNTPAKDVIYYAQDGPEYGSVTYKYGTNKQYTCTIGECGCGYAALAMVAATLNNDRTITPKTVLEYVHGTGISINNNGGAITNQALVDPRVASKYGMRIESVYGWNSSNGGGKEQQKQIISQSVNEGKLLIVLIRNSNGGGHYIVIGGKGNDLSVNNPLQSVGQKHMSVDQLLNTYNIQNITAYSKA